MPRDLLRFLGCFLGLSVGWVFWFHLHFAYRWESVAIHVMVLSQSLFCVTLGAGVRQADARAKQVFQILDCLGLPIPEGWEGRQPLGEPSHGAVLAELRHLLEMGRSGQDRVE